MTMIDCARPHHRTATWALAGVMAILALYILWSTIYWVAETFRVIPYLDQWAIVSFVQNLERPNSLVYLWSQHNEHRIVIPRLISIADYAWFQGRGHLDLAVIWLWQIGTAVIVFDLSMRAMAPLSDIRAWRTFAAALIVALLFSVTQIENLAFPFQTCFVGLTFFAAVAFFCLDRSAGVAPEERVVFWAWVSGAVTAAVASMLCLASGIFTPIVLLAGGYLSRWPKRALAATAVVALVCVLCYLHGYVTPNPHGRPLEALQHPRTVLLYVAIYLGAITRPGDPFSHALGAAIGLGVVVVLLVLLLRLWKAGLLVIPSLRKTTTTALSPIASANIALLCIVAVGIGQALITALGRYNFGLDQAMSSRYYSVRLLIWACVVLMALGIAARSRLQSGRWTLATAALGLCAVVTLASEQRIVGQGAKGGAVTREIAMNSLLTGVFDGGALDRAGSGSDVTTRGVSFLAPRKLSLFADPWYGALGQPIQSMVNVSSPETCVGRFETISQDGVIGGYKVSGWAWSLADKRAFDRIVLVDGQARLVGLATVGVSRQDVRENSPNVRNKFVGWIGYAQTSDTVSAYGIVDGKPACKLAGSFAVGSHQETERMAPHEQIHVWRSACAGRQH